MSGILRTSAIQLRRAASIKFDNGLAPRFEFNQSTVDSLSTSTQQWNKTIIDLQTTTGSLLNLPTISILSSKTSTPPPHVTSISTSETSGKSKLGTLRRSQSDSQLSQLEQSTSSSSMTVSLSSHSRQRTRQWPSCAAVIGTTQSIYNKPNNTSSTSSKSNAAASALDGVLHMLPVAVVVESKLQRSNSESELPSLLLHNNNNNHHHHHHHNNNNNNTVDPQQHRGRSDSTPSTSDDASSYINTPTPTPTTTTTGNCSSTTMEPPSPSQPKQSQSKQQKRYTSDAMLLNHCTSLCQMLIDAKEFRIAESQILFNQGLTHHRKNKLDLALDCYSKSAELGNAKAMVNAASLLLNGAATISPTAASRAIQLLESACLQHNIRALTMVGTALCFGSVDLGLQRNEIRGAKMLKEAALQGSEEASEAMLQLSRCFAKGIGFRKSPTEALRWCKKAATSGAARAQFTLGRWHQSGELGPSSLTQATHWYTQAAAQQHPGAMRSLQLLQQQQ